MAEPSPRFHSTGGLERLLLLVLALAVLVTVGANAWRSRPSASHADLLEAAEAGYRALWAEVDDVASGAAREIGATDLDAGDSLVLFESVAAAVPRSGRRSWTLYVLDPVDRIRAWGGAGLLHSLAADSLPPAGRSFRASLTSVTLLSVAEVPDEPGWRVLAGTSLAASQLPFAMPGRAHLETSWGLAPIGAATPPGRAEVSLPDTPTLLIDDAGLARAPAAGQRRRWFVDPLTWSGAWLLLAASAFRRRLWWMSALLVTLGISLWGLGAGAGVDLVLSLALAVAAALTSAALARRRCSVSPALGVGVRWLGALWRGVVGAMLLLAAAWVLQQGELVDLAEHFVVSGELWVRRAVLFVVALAWLGFLVTAKEDDEGARGTRAIWLGAMVVGASAAAVDWPLLGAALLLTGSAIVSAGVGGRSIWRRPLIVGGMVVIAALAAATANELSYRWELRQRLAGTTLEALAPPSSQETKRMRADLAEHFERLDIGDLAAADLRDLDPSDLAFEVWRRSPLARGRSVSAVALRGFGGEDLLFSFGIPLDTGGRPQVQSRERPFDRPVWDHTLINEAAPVVLDQRPWGEVEYWLLVRPGFRLAETRLGDISVDLLRGGPSGRGAVQKLVHPALYAHYSAPRQARISPWLEAPALSQQVVDDGQGRLGTPAGLAWVWTASEPEGTRALFLPRLGPVESLERVGTHAIGNLWPLAVLALVILASRLARSEFRSQVWSLWHSYSRRLVLVFSFLVLAPAVVVDVVVLRVLTERLEAEQLAEARGALAAAQRVLGEYAEGQDPGISLNTLFDDDLLSWLSQVLDHEVNLYWARTSQLAASSRRELFAAGLLSQRIPGEMYADLQLRGQRLTSRLHRSETAEYSELYAPLLLPGQQPRSAGFFLSIPLMAQEAEVAEEIEGLRHTVVLGTILLVLLLVALGVRLAASFTAPLEELVEGTERIAAGAERLGLAPRELELATLVAAIDHMAERIAEGRRKLLLEKRVVERMVENITAAVVSIDGDHRVLMQNEIAAKLLGTEIGVALETSLVGRENLEKVLEGLRRSEELGSPQSVNLPTGEENETRQWSLVWVPIPGPEQPKALVVVEDVTEVVRPWRDLGSEPHTHPPPGA